MNGSTDGSPVILGLAALRRYREQQEAQAAQPGRQASLLAEVPPDAPCDKPDAALHVWNGSRWVPWDVWRVTAPITAEPKAAEETPQASSEHEVAALAPQGSAPHEVPRQRGFDDVDLDKL